MEYTYIVICNYMDCKQMGGDYGGVSRLAQPRHEAHICSMYNYYVDIAYIAELFILYM